MCLHHPIKILFLFKSRPRATEGHRKVNGTTSILSVLHVRELGSPSVMETSREAFSYPVGIYAGSRDHVFNVHHNG